MFTDEARSALTDGLGRVELPTPAQIRRRGTARTRHQVLAGIAAAVTLVSGAGLALASQPQDGPNRPVTASPSTLDHATPTPSQSPAVPVSPSEPPSSPRYTTIPDDVLLRSADLGGARIDKADLGYWRNGGRIPPRPCAGTGRSGGARPTAERAVQSMILPEQSRFPGPHVVVEYVALYDAGGAQTFMTELRTALNRCPGNGTPQSPTWTALGKVNAGDDSLLIRYTDFGGYTGDPGTKTDQYLAVVRIGRVIMVLASVGWEIDSGYVALVRELAPVAADRLRRLA